MTDGEGMYHQIFVAGEAGAESSGVTVSLSTARLPNQKSQVVTSTERYTARHFSYASLPMRDIQSITYKANREKRGVTEAYYPPTSSPTKPIDISLSDLLGHSPTTSSHLTTPLAFFNLRNWWHSREPMTVLCQRRAAPSDIMI